MLVQQILLIYPLFYFLWVLKDLPKLTSSTKTLISHFFKIFTRTILSSSCNLHLVFKNLNKQELGSIGSLVLLLFVFYRVWLDLHSQLYALITPNWVKLNFSKIHNFKNLDNCSEIFVCTIMGRIGKYDKKLLVAKLSSLIRKKDNIHVYWWQETPEDIFVWNRRKKTYDLGFWLDRI